jgi:UDP-glucose 4-epimerase
MGDEGGYLDEHSVPNPLDDYGKSKLEAERGLAQLQSEQFTVSIVRPPLIYGPRVKGNVLRILQLLSKPWPLPLGGIHNERSMVAVGNLIALIERIIEVRASGTFIAGDAAPISTTELVRELAEGMASPARLFALPRWAQRSVLHAFPRVGQRLFGSYVILNANTNHQLDFSCPLQSSVALRETGRWYAACHLE